MRANSRKVAHRQARRWAWTEGKKRDARGGEEIGDSAVNGRAAYVHFRLREQSCRMASAGALASPLGRAVAATGTANQWSLLEALVPKVNRHLQGGAATLQDMEALLASCSADDLRMEGIWVQDLGHKIICVNRAYASARRSEVSSSGAAAVACTCGASTGSGRTNFTSTNYNAAGGRHETTASLHNGRCPCWRPSPTSHLHSWRRGYTKQ